MDFVGAKAALFCDGHLLTYQRDDHAGLPWAGHWDLPGGGREGEETPVECILREVQEEFGLRLPPLRLIWQQVFSSMVDPTQFSVFFGGSLQAKEVKAITFGDEGQRWALMPLAEFLAH